MLVEVYIVTLVKSINENDALQLQSVFYGYRIGANSSEIKK